jgi:hypothetical protein
MDELMRRVAAVGLLLSLPAAAAAQVNTAIVPAPGRTTWSPGVTTGIPNRTTVCATVNASTYGNGSSSATTGIQTAINNCPAGQVVMLSAGTFLVNNYVIINKSITLRGSGWQQTKLVKTNGAKPGSESAVDNQPIVIIGPNRWPKADDTTSRNLSVNGAQGSNSVTVADATGFAAGQFVLVDRDDYSVGAWISMPNRNGQPTAAKIWASDEVVFMRHSPSEGQDDPFPDSLTWFSRANRPVNEMKEVASVSGNTLTFTTPLHASYPTAKASQVTRFTGGNVHVKNAGVEQLSTSGGSDGQIRFEAAAYSWMKDVENTVWLGEGVALNASFRVEVRDSYIHHAAWPQPGGAGYAISFGSGSADSLVENNIIIDANKMMVARSSGAGSVVAYNYADDGHIFTDPSWIEVGINGSHMVGSHHMLFEGNESFNYDSDNTHGNAFAHTIFRNHLIGKRRSFSGTSNLRTGGLMHGSWWHAFIGNVMGVNGQMSGWIYNDGGPPQTGNQWSSSPSVWKLGYDPTHWEQSADPKVLSTALRDGNFDYLTNTVKWDRTAQTLPDSLYLASKPAFFGSNPWPWVDPTGPVKLAVLPARQRYETIVNGGTQTPAPAAPTNLHIIR